MSADDWRSCPVCQGLPDKLKTGYKQFYGKVPEEEYNILKDEYESAMQSNPVRVDIEYGLNADGTISLGLFAKCGICGAEWNHQGLVK